MICVSPSFPVKSSERTILLIPLLLALSASCASSLKLPLFQTTTAMQSALIVSTAAAFIEYFMFG